MNDRKDQEQDLFLELDRSRARLRAEGRLLGHSIGEAFDILRPVRRAPVGGIISSVATGLLLSGLYRSFSRRKGVSGNGAPSGMSLISNLLGRMVPMLVPALMTLATGWAARRSEKRAAR